jgi:hypothetical protein
MNAHLKMLLNVSGIAKRNDSLSLVRTGKGNNNVPMSRPVPSLNRALWPIDIRTRCQKINAPASTVCFSPFSVSPSMMWLTFNPHNSSTCVAV